MSGKKISKGKRFWKRALREFEGSGLTVKDFCGLKGIGASTFYQYRSKFNNRLNNRGPDQGGFTPLHIEEDFVKSRPLASKVVIDEGNLFKCSDSHEEAISQTSKKINSSGPKVFDLHIGEKLLLKIPFGFDVGELRRLVCALC